jgi:Fe2+ or Zn2+ uptake regulation protein
MTADLDATATARLRAVGQRYTANRRAVVAVLAAAGQPLAIPEILEARPGLAQSSLYRNLAVLEQAGVVHRIVTSAEFARFELAEDLTEHHHHLICSACGAVEDFTAPAGLERTMSRVMTDVARATGFAPDRHRIDLVGRCSRCA